MKGLTLLELLVSLAIASLLIGFSFAGYRFYLAKKQVDMAAQVLATDLAMLRSQARAGVKSRQCNELAYYEIWSVNKSLKYRQVCDNYQQPWQTISEKEWQSLSNWLYRDGDDNQKLRFLALEGRLSAVTTDPSYFRLYYQGRCRQVNLYKVGTIEEQACQ